MQKRNLYKNKKSQFFLNIKVNKRRNQKPATKKASKKTAI